MQHCKLQSINKQVVFKWVWVVASHFMKFCYSYHNWDVLSPVRPDLTHWGRDKITVIVQTIISNTFSGLSIVVFWFKFHRIFFFSLQLIICQYLILVWHRIRDKPVFKPMMDYFAEAHMRHSASVSEIGIQRFRLVNMVGGRTPVYLKFCVIFVTGCLMVTIIHYGGIQHKRYFLNGVLPSTRHLRDTNGPLNNSIIIYARVRTGSTYTSEFFHRHKSVFYIFEPLQYVHFDQVFSHGTDTVKRIFSCGFSGVHMKGIMQHQRTWWKDRFCHIPGYEICKNFTISAAETVCRNSRYNVAKVILFRKVQYLQPLIDEGSRVIMLIRDPRGLINSYRLTSSSRYPKGKGFEFNDANWYCNNMLRDLDYIRTKTSDLRSYHIIRYEDLAVDPVKGVHDLYEYIGIPPDDNLLQWAEDVDKGQKHAKETPLSTERNNATVAAQRWRKHLNIKLVLQIQEACAKFMDIFGYTQVFTDTELHDYNIFLKEPRNLRELMEN